MCPGWLAKANGGVVVAQYLPPPPPSPAPPMNIRKLQRPPEPQPVSDPAPTTAQALAQMVDENERMAAGVVILIVVALLALGCLLHRIFCRKSFTESVPCGAAPGDRNWVDFKGEEVATVPQNP